MCQQQLGGNLLLLPSLPQPHPASQPSQQACTLRDVSRYFPSSWKSPFLWRKLSSTAKVLVGKYPGTARDGQELSKKPLDCWHPPQGPAGQRHVFWARCRVGCSSLGCWPCLLKKSSVTICTWPATWECWGGRSTWLL